MTNKRLLLISVSVVVLFLGGLLLNAQRITPSPHFHDLDSGSGLDALYAIGLAGLVLFLAAGLGQQLTNPFKHTNWSFVERTVISLPLGLAVIGYSEFFLGLIGWIKPIHHISLLTIISMITIKESVSFLKQAFMNLGKFKETWHSFSLMMKIIYTAGVLALFLAFLQTLTPPWAYDGLMYHLQGPRLFLEAGRIIPIPENWFTFYPSTWGMLYMLGMGLGSDIFARLMHFTTLLLFIFATYAFGKRFLPAPGGWIAAAIIMGMPQMMIWGSFAYIDIAWGVFQFLAVALVLVWLKESQCKYLVLSGIMQGLALGSKYLAFSSAGIVVLCIFWLSLNQNKGSDKWKQAAGNAFIFGIGALFVALPWYLKNYIWTGNPIFPMILPQNIINPAELALWLSYVNGFGVGKRWYNYLLLPISLYLQNINFTTFVRRTDFISPLFLFVFAYPWIRKKFQYENLNIFDTIMIITVMQFFAWALGSQQNRFLIPLFPGLSILASAVMINITFMKTTFRWDKIIAIVTAGGMVIGTLILMWIYFIRIQPHNVVLGKITKSEFLQSRLSDYSGIEFINTQLPKGSKVLMPWNGKGYYCDSRCAPDISQAKWSVLIQEKQTIKNVNEWLRKNDYSHILVSWEDIDYFTIEHDPQNIHREAALFLKDEILPNCAKEIYTDDWVRIFLIKLQNNDTFLDK